MPRHQYIIDPSTGAPDMEAHKADGHMGPVCYICGEHVCVNTCTKKRGKLVPLGEAQCKGSEAFIYVVYDTNAHAQSFHMTKQGAESAVRNRLARDRKSGKVHDEIEPYPIVEEEIWL